MVLPVFAPENLTNKYFVTHFSIALENRRHRMKGLTTFLVFTYMSIIRGLNPPKLPVDLSMR